MKTGENSGGFTNWLSPQWGFWQRYAGQKVKDPAIPWGAVVTNDWCNIYIRGFSSAKLKQPLFI